MARSEILMLARSEIDEKAYPWPWVRVRVRIMGRIEIRVSARGMDRAWYR